MIRSTIPFAIALACAPLGAQQSEAPDSIYQLAQVEVRPEALNGEELGAALYARYPAPLKAAGVSGEVTVSMVVGPDGVPRGVELVSSTNSLFNAPTLEVASLLRFSPGQMGGRPVPVRIVLPVPWMAGPVDDAPGPDSLGAYELREVDARPRLTNHAELGPALERNFPPALRESGAAGEVSVRLLVNPDGTGSHHLVTHSTNEAFNAPTLAALQALRFAPARLRGTPVPVWVRMLVQWPDDVPGPDATGAYTLSEVERQPQSTNIRVLQRALERAYPPELRDAGITGTVQVRLRIDEQGGVSNLSVTASSDERFNLATLTAVQSLRFRPARIGGRPVPVWVELPIHWSMGGGPVPRHWHPLERPDPEPGQPAIGCTINTPRGCG